jgi:hypothetical protein
VNIEFSMGNSFPALLDLGSDYKPVPQTLIQALEEAGMFVPSRTLDTPVKFDHAIKGTTATITRQAQLQVEIKLPAGPLRFRNFCWLVAEHDMNKVLIGRPLLNSLGIDAPTHLAAVRQTFQDMDCSAVLSALAGGKLSRLLKQRAGFILATPVGDSPAVHSDKCPHALSRSDSSRCSDTASAETQFAQVFHGDTDVDTVNAPHMLTLSSSNEETEIWTQKERMIGEASQNGLSTDGAQELKALVDQYPDIWRLSLGPGTPAKLPQTVIRLESGAKPVRVKLRRYAPAQRQFLKRFLNELVAAGHAFRNPNATWCCAPLIVPKQGADQFRFTVHLRPVNNVTIPSSWPMPHLDSELNRVAGSSVFATFDLSQGYWQLSLDVDSQDCQSVLHHSRRIIYSDSCTAWYYKRCPAFSSICARKFRLLV